MKKAFKITFIVAISLAVLLVVLLAVSAITAAGMHSGSVGIIGGADGPTAVFVTKTVILDNPLFWIAFVLLVVAVVSGIGWAVSKE